MILSDNLERLYPMIFRTPPDPRLTGEKLICAPYAESMPPVRPIGSDGTRSRIPLGPPIAESSDESEENSDTGISLFRYQVSADRFGLLKNT